MQSISLQEIFQSHNGRLIHKWNHYFEIYERYLAPYRGTKVNILEIGISHGGSLQMWRKYLGPQANIFAVDINPECKQFEDTGIKIFIGSQDDEHFLSSLKTELPPIDILIDDGGHTMSQQIRTFNHLFPLVKDGGVYMVEDTHTSYWYEFHGGYKNKNSFIEFSKSIVDQVHAWHIDDPKLVPVNYLTENINSVSFFDSVVVFEKKKRQEPTHSMKGMPTIKGYTDTSLKKDSIIRRIWKKITPKKQHSFNRQLK